MRRQVVPKPSFTSAYSQPNFSQQRSASASAKIVARPSCSTATYPASGFKITAWLAGRVHGVVVHMATSVLPAKASSPSGVLSSSKRT